MNPLYIWGGPWRDIDYVIRGRDVVDIGLQKTHLEPDTLEVTLIGDSAARIIAAIEGYLPDTEPTPEPVNRQDEALAAARRDALEAKRRAQAAEDAHTALEDTLADYEGEIETLRAEVARLKVANAMTVSFDPAPPGGPRPNSTGFATGGYVSGKGRTLSEQVETLDRWVRRERVRRHPMDEPWHTEYLNQPILSAEARAHLEKYDPFTYGDN
jgi:hypothetical protein